MRTQTCLLILCLTVPMATAAAGPVDPFLWLEEIQGEKALEWVEKQNKASTSELKAVPEFKPIHEKNLEVYNSDERIPYVAIRGKYLYNFWQDKVHVRGLWRRTTLDEYRKKGSAWETVLDLDALANAEKENWVWKRASCLEPSYERCMLSLSRGGKDAKVQREFDLVTKEFVEGGFKLPEAKSSVNWKDKDTLWVGTDFGEGTLTQSGYPRLAKEWKRGTPLSKARLVFEGQSGDNRVDAFSIHTPEGRYDIVYRAPAFYKAIHYLILDGRLVRLDFPEDANLKGIFKGQLLISLRTPWKAGGRTYPADALLAMDLNAFLMGERDFQILFEPGPRLSLGEVTNTRNQLLVSTLENVRGRLHRWTFSDGTWIKTEEKLPGMGTVSIEDTADQDDTWFFSYTDFIEPSSLYLVQEGKSERVKALPAFFDTSGVQVVQHQAKSRDGTRIPYFLVTPNGFKADRKNPTLLYGYGGFEIPMRARYSATVGHAWLERGGVYVLANIRGGGEFGPRWHQAALKENRHKSFEDFIAVAQDLIARKITSPKHLGIMGGSNGGLLVGAVFTMRPDLFNAVVCAVPLLDMRRYHKLLAGHSWMAEFGDPDKPNQWRYIRKYSPYHNLKMKKKYPKVFFFTSTRDDRVHPGHARKMVAKMQAMKKPVLYWENTEGGHGAAANNNQRANMWALAYSYLWKMLR